MRVGGVLSRMCARRCAGVLAHAGQRFPSASLFSRSFFSSVSSSGAFKGQSEEAMKSRSGVSFSCLIYLLFLQDESVFDMYVQAQELCIKRAPEGFHSFHALVTSQNLVFRDVTQSFSTFGFADPNQEGKFILIRPRRWGKSVLGAAWIEYMRGRGDLFIGTWAEKNMRKDKLIGVHLDLSNGGASIGQCVEAIMDAINKCLELAEKVEGYGGKAKGRRVSINPDFLKVKPVQADWTLPDCTSLVRRFFADLERISNDAGRQVALFVDEYDKPCITALGEPDYAVFMKFFQDFYTQLKASTCVPFLFVTGSSRLSLKGFFSGANNVTDVSYESRAATTLGYTWDEIEKLFSEQLPLLEKLHGMSRQELKTKMEAWYNNYRWSPDVKTCVFNPLSVNEFVRTGDFVSHWKILGGWSQLLNKQLFQSEVLRLVVSKDARVMLSLDDLKGVDPMVRVQDGLGKEGQLSVLAASGVLTIAPECDWTSNPIPLMIPNFECQNAAVGVLQVACTSYLTNEVRAAVSAYLGDGDVVRLLKALDATEQVANCAVHLAGESKSIESHVQQALIFLILAARKDVTDFHVASEVVVRKDFSRKWLDLALVLRGQDTAYAIELECCEEPKKKENSDSLVLKNKLIHGLDQLKQDCKDFSMDGFKIGKRMYSCALFGKDGRLIAITKALTFEEIPKVQESLKSDNADERVEWIK
jgi:hypothetical protein